MWFKREKVYNRACFKAYVFSCFCVCFFFIIFSAFSRPVDLMSYLVSITFMTPFVFVFGIVGYGISWLINYTLYKRGIKSYWAWFGLGVVVTLLSIALLILTLQGIGIAMAPFYILGGTCMSLSFPYWIRLVQNDSYDFKEVILEKRTYVDDLYIKGDGDK